MTTQSGTCQPSCCTISIATVFWPSSRRRVHRVGQVDALVAAQPRGPAACSRRSPCRWRRTSAPFARGWTSWAVVILPCGRKHRRPGCRRRRSRRRARRTCRRSRRRRRRGSALPSAIIWSTILTSTVIPRSLNEPVCDVAAQLDAHVRHAEAAAVALARQQGGACPRPWSRCWSSSDARADPLLLAPDAAGRRAPRRRPSARRRAPSTRPPLVRQRVHVVAHLEQARRTCGTGRSSRRARSAVAAGEASKARAVDHGAGV